MTRRHLHRGVLGGWAIIDRTQFTDASLALAAAAGTFALTGTAIALLMSRRLVASGGSFTLSGQTAALLVGRAIAAGAGAFALTGSDAGLNLPAAKTIVAGPGSFAVTGTSAALLQARKVAASAGSFAVSGVAATLKAAKRAVAAAGSFALTGTDASVKLARKVVAAAGSFALTGTAVTLTKSSPLTFTYIGKCVSQGAALNFSSLDAGAIAAGDLLLYNQFARTGAGGLSLVTPSGFAEGANYASGTTLRGQITYKLSSGSEGSVTGMDGGSDDQKIGLVFRPSRAISTVTFNATTGECTTGNPASKSVAISGTGSYPALLYGFMAARTGGTITPTVTPNTMTENDVGVGDKSAMTHHLIYDSAAADLTAYDMADISDQCIYAGYITFT